MNKTHPKAKTMRISESTWLGITSTCYDMYTEESFWKKLLKYAVRLGQKVVREILILYYTMHRKDVPLQVKSIICGALGYFIFPIDFIPDFTPVVGFSDDIAIVGFCLAYVRCYTTNDEIHKAETKIKDIFGNRA